jgi:tryptophan synthase beta chain
MTIPQDYHRWPDEHGRFGNYGGSYVAETLMARWLS